MLKVDEDWLVFRVHCTHYQSSDTCAHGSRIISKCLEKKYCPRIAKPAKPKKDQPLWATHYQTYLEEIYRETERILEDPECTNALLKLLPSRFDLKETMLKAMRYWVSQKGYERKVKSKVQKIDWFATYKSAVQMSYNQVLKIKEGFLSSD